ncbi:ATP-binding domain-containing protein [Nonomuraea rubra]|uniref:ATP-binding domain-containing protein n=1 Tax=Nonomuraea rubra TaxID=46180 RepID=UPI0031ED4D30
MATLDDEREYVERCRAGLRRMLEGARDNVIVGETVAGDRYSAERLGRHLKSLAKELSEEPEGPPFFGLLDFGAGLRRARGAGVPHRPPAHQRRARRPARRDRLACAGLARLLPGQCPRSAGRGRTSPLRLVGHHPHRLRGRAALARGGGREQDPRGRDRAPPRRAHARHRRHHPARAGRPRPRRAGHLHLRPGRPGTGKTAVGLHRAAYCSTPTAGASSAPACSCSGPTGPSWATSRPCCRRSARWTSSRRRWNGCWPPSPVTAVDGEATAEVKHDARMARVLRRALYGRIAKPVEPVAVPDGSFRWRVYEDELRRIVDDTRRESLPYGTGRERVRARVVESIRRQAEARGQTATAPWLRRIGRGVTPWLDRIWPSAKPQEVLYELLRGPAPDGRDPARGLLTDAERAALTWSRPPRSVRSAKWSAADLVLLDELGALIERPRGYGHVIVDEAQDLSPMECRAVARRSEHGSLTVLGDLAQGTTPWAASSWPERLELLGKPGGEVIALTTGFRVPAAVVELANTLLAALEVEVPATRSYRSDGRLRVMEVPVLEKGVVEAVREASGFEGSIGVIAADAGVEAISAALWNEGLDVSGRLSVMPASMCKGLEYDHVVVAEPAAIAEAERRGLNRLYVALTRAVSRLDVVHARPLPPQLARPS